jgi:hypothetical protein
VNAGANTLDELSGSSLSFLGSSATNLSHPDAVLAKSGDVWVGSDGTAGKSLVTQFKVVRGAIESPWMKSDSSGAYDFDNPVGFAVFGSSLWVANASDNLLDEMVASSGELVGTHT